MQALQARVAAQQEACDKKDAELDAVYRHREELEALLAEDNAAGSDRRHATSDPSRPALMLSAPSEPKVCGGCPAGGTECASLASHEGTGFLKGTVKIGQECRKGNNNTLMMWCSPAELSDSTSITSHGLRQLHAIL